MNDDSELQKLRYDNKELRDASDRLCARIEALEAAMRYTVTIAPHELEAMREMVIYARAMVKVLTASEGGDPLGVKLTNYAQMIEDVVERIEQGESK